MIYFWHKLGYQTRLVNFFMSIRFWVIKWISNKISDASEKKNKDFYKKGNDKLIRNYGIGAQIIKDLKIKNMILITKSHKKVIGLDGYDIKITKQELI